MRASLKDAGLTRRTLLRACVGGAAALVLPGCLTSQPPATFDLGAPSDFAPSQGRNIQLLVLEPSALKTLDSQGVVVRTSPTELTYLSGAQWTDRLPKVVQARMVEAFENTGRLRAVSRPGDGLVIDYQIATDIRTFQVGVDGRDEAQVTLSMKLISDRNGKVVGTQVFSQTLPLANDQAAIAVAGLNTAFERALRDIVGWVFKTI